ncbi:hypothetical protein HG536_0A08810 [Torulaspora globosa]|uniref:Meiotically up-regulated protein Msb1/Mug8 domain-containing protein n=1 Tax=Torulaspora globosa TaxID=48254 RepID=A0A7G3ZC28_9SACH|nr:uncharacterized protein HG536_0A08810 [Torulaspora globosa]QLL31064.1 hypothetical protein HG536_0A08810 [Torulaspora globosa]
MSSMFRNLKERFRSNGNGSGNKQQLRSSSSVMQGLEKMRRGERKQKEKPQVRSFSAPIEVPKPVFSPLGSPRTVSSEVMSSVSGGQGNRYYIYDSKAYLNADKSERFDIFEKPGAINPTSTRYVIQYLINRTRELILQNEDSKVLLQVFKPNLHHFSQKEVVEVTSVLKNLFPHDGCSLKGDDLATAIKANFKERINTLSLALRILWNQFPLGIMPWDSYHRFVKWERENGYPLESFHFRLSKFLPNKDYTFCVFAFLEFILCILLQNNKQLIHKSGQMDLIFTAGPTCFTRERTEDPDDDLPPVIRSYHNRGSALHRLFVGYLRSLNHEGKVNDFYLSDIFHIDQYPPAAYTARSSKALTLTIPFESSKGNDFTTLIYQAATAKQRFYSSKTSFSKVENNFLDQFEDQTLRVITTFFSESSNRYITTFDNGFNTEVLDNSENGKQGPKVGDDQYAVATWLQFAKEQNSFDELLGMLEGGNCAEGGTLALGAGGMTLQQPMKLQRERADDSKVRVGKMDVTEWIISAWKNDMFMGKVQNTLLIKLTKKIGECNWLVITCERQQRQRRGDAPTQSISGTGNANALNDLLDSCYTESVIMT